MSEFEDLSKKCRAVASYFVQKYDKDAVFVSVNELVEAIITKKDVKKLRLVSLDFDKQIMALNADEQAELLMILNPKTKTQDIKGSVQLVIEKGQASSEQEYSLLIDFLSDYSCEDLDVTETELKCINSILADYEQELSEEEAELN